jgi:hypothetical protein
VSRFADAPHVLGGGEEVIMQDGTRVWVGCYQVLYVDESRTSRKSSNVKIRSGYFASRVLRGLREGYGSAKYLAE